jgi:hypothetical protein
LLNAASDACPISAEMPNSHPTTGIAGWARAASGEAATAPPIDMIKSRRLM